jgi:hypothetical protein
MLDLDLLSEYFVERSRWWREHQGSGGGASGVWGGGNHQDLKGRVVRRRGGEDHSVYWTFGYMPESENNGTPYAYSSTIALIQTHISITEEALARITRPPVLHQHWS